VSLFPDRDASEQTLAMFKAAAHGGAAQLYIHLATGHLAFARHDYKGALEAWRSVDAHLANDSAKKGGGQHFLFAYLVTASALAGNPEAVAQRLDEYRARYPEAEETILANAVLNALKGNSIVAKAEFWRAFLRSSNSPWHATSTTRLAVLE